MLVAVLMSMMLAGCTLLVQPPEDNPPGPPPDDGGNPPKPEFAILMSGEPLPGQWAVLPYPYFYEGQLITFSILYTSQRPEHVSWRAWAEDRPDVVYRSEELVWRRAFYGRLCGEHGPRRYEVWATVDAGGERYEVEAEFYIVRYSDAGGWRWPRSSTP